jgi:hypothetical protein
MSGLSGMLRKNELCGLWILPEVFGFLFAR